MTEPLTEPSRQGKADKTTDAIYTIGDLLHGLEGEELVDRLSDGEFDVSYISYISRYAHREELFESCALAVKESSSLPFTRTNCAGVMGRAMELLRSVHKTDAPRGWLPAMRRLRSAGEAVELAAAYTELPSTDPRSPFHVPPEEVLTHTCSAIRSIADDEERRWLAEMEQGAAAMVVALARERGAPGGWRDAEPFVAEAIRRTDAVCGAALVPLAAILGKLRERLA